MKVSIVAKEYKRLSKQFVSKNLTKTPNEVKITFQSGRSYVDVVLDLVTLECITEEFYAAREDLRTLEQGETNTKFNEKMEFFKKMEDIYNQAIADGFTTNEIIESTSAGFKKMKMNNGTVNDEIVAKLQRVGALSGMVHPV